jgi:hypothetical protein
MIDITPILHSVLTVAAALITAFAVPWIKAHVSDARLRSAQAWVTIAVKAAEQIYDSGKGAEKLAYVKNYLNDKGITYDEAQIEAAVGSLLTSANFRWEAPNIDNN